MRNFINRFAKDESGATAIEYGLIAALIAVAIIGALGAVKGGGQAASEAMATPTAASRIRVEVFMDRLLLIRFEADASSLTVCERC